LKRSWLFCSFLCLLAFLVKSDSSLVSKGSLRSQLDLPRVVLWAWERPQDLRSLDASRFGVAYLDQTIYIADRVLARPNLNPILLNDKTRVVAVVRVEMQSHANPREPAPPARVAALIVKSVGHHGATGLQIDFDATLSQRAFYRELLGEVRKRMPAGMPLTITALASWCGSDAWLQGLPIDEAVPMFFRMEPVRSPYRADGWEPSIRERRCQASAGISMDEPWPALNKDARVYVFHPRAWSGVALQNVEEMVYP
jgi:hypothetical protein